MKTIILLLLLISCTNNELKSKKNIWDFTKDNFGESSIRMLGGFSEFNFQKKSDSLIVLNSSLFQGWKKEWIRNTDTLKLTENYFVIDSLGNQTKQIVSYSSSEEIFFQLTITDQHLENEGFKKNSKTNKNNSNLPDEKEQEINKKWFTYKGKLFINKNNLHYFEKNLWVK